MEGPISSPSELPGRIQEMPGVQLQAPPLMHVSALWGSLGTLLGGNTAVLLSPGRFDPMEVLATIERETVMICVLVGDAMARPLADALAEARKAFDLASLFVVASGGAILQPDGPRRAPGPPARPAGDRRLRLLGDRRDGNPDDHGVGPRGRGLPHVPDGPGHDRARRRRPAHRTGLGGDREARPAGPDAARLLQRPREVAGHLRR